MPPPIVAVENISKRYTLGRRRSYGSLREEMMHALAARFRRPPAADPSPTTLWALKDVSFSVDQGEVLGIIGRNGAGKSTLLKILSRITDPTAGQVVLRGRVASLLEVGTGFHPELTGRENVFLNGALLGMSSAEIRSKFDDIVEFAGVERFLETPVKRFSSGMYVRLAFAVAAHLDPEILLIDEVLAVGDAGFQRRCLGKMNDVARSGRTVLFVSHNMGAIRSLCDRALLFRGGSLVCDAPAQTTIRQYLADDAISAEGEVRFEAGQFAHIPLKLWAVRTMGRDEAIRTEFSNHEPIIIEMEFSLAEPIPSLVVGFSLKTANDTLVLMSGHNDARETLSYRADPAYRYRLRATIPARLLNGGRYYLDAFASRHKVSWLIKDLRALSVNVSFSVPNTDYIYGDGRRGCISPILDWTEIRASSAQ